MGTTDSRETRISVKAEQWRHTGEPGVPDSFYISFPGAALVSDYSESKARAKAQAHVQTALLDAAWLSEQAHRFRVLHCANGTTLLVRSPARDFWEYRILPGRCSCGVGGSFDDAVRKARSHAQQSFGGVAWEDGSYVDGDTESKAAP